MITEARIPPTLSVSIVLHNSSPDQLRITLRSLMASVVALHDQLREPVALTILDNCSEPEYRDQLAQLLSELEVKDAPAVDLSVRHSNENLGFGGGHNLVYEDRPGRYFLILNPDVELAADALYEGLRYLEANAGVVALNPYCERTDGSREYLCKRYPTAFDLLLRGLPFSSLRQIFSGRLARYEYRDLEHAAPGSVTLLSGACLLCRGGSFAGAGRFDERYFMYFEDFDLSRRLAVEGQLMFLPTMRIVHQGGFAAKKGMQHIRWFTRSALRFFSIHGWRLL
ncbi:glycosyltransferase [Congregibacter sp.]|uniref:glycosyltransferase n=1 Tax=Congregibacter sp. TaxID=2744308 RepID=UPI00385CEE67